MRKYDSCFRKEKRRVCIILYNCPAHPKSIENLTNIEMIYLPPNATSRIQPMDAGIIKYLKTMYREKLMQKRLLAYDAGADFNVNLVDSMKMLSQCWDQIPSQVIRNCYKHCGFTDPAVSVNDDVEIIADSTNTVDIEDVWNRTKNIVPVGVELEVYLDIDTDIMTCESIEAFVVEPTNERTSSHPVEDPSDSDKSEENAVEIPDPTLLEAFEALIVLRSYFDRRHSQCNKESEAVEEALMNNLPQKTQSSISNFFKNSH